PNAGQDRHRGGGHPPTPATPPCVRVRTRRFELVALTAIDQRRKSQRFEVSIGKPNREGLGPSQVPRATSTASRVIGESATDPSDNRAARRRRGVFHCRHIAARSRNRTQRVRYISSSGVSQKPK